MSDLLDQILGIIEHLKDDELKLQQILDYLETEVIDEDYNFNAMDELPEKYRPMVNEIAQYMEMGMLCFLNPDSAELEFIPQEIFEESNYDDDPVKVKQELLDTHGWVVESFLDWEKSISFEPLPSYESFGIMEKYIHQLPDDEKLKPRLIDAIRNRKPFANFGRIIDNSELREEWFEFKKAWLDNLVAGQLVVELEKLKEETDEI